MTDAPGFPAPTLAAVRSFSSLSQTIANQWLWRSTVTSAAVQAGRILALAHLRLWDREAEADRVTLGVSELLTNVLRHTAEPQAQLLMQCLPDCVLVSVSDSDPRLPVVRHVDLMSETGRGLTLLRAVVDDFGASSHLYGKDVWFRVDSTPSAGP